MEIKLIFNHFNVLLFRIEDKIDHFVKFFIKCMGFDKPLGVVLICILFDRKQDSIYDIMLG